MADYTDIDKPDDEPQRISVELIGPFVGEWKVSVEGREVPFLTAEPVNGGRVFLHLDHRMCWDLPVDDLDRTVHFIADCIAVGMGYTCHPRADEEPVLRPPFPRLIGL